MSKPTHSASYVISLAFSLLAISNSCLAQNNTYSSLSDRTARTKQALVELDDKALTCMSSFNLNLGEAAALLCDEFMRAIDGEFLAAYLEDCSALKAWRDTFIEQSEAVATAQETAEALELMIAIEASCGENALQKRATYVVDAFNTLAKGALLNRSVTQTFAVRLSELEQQTRIDRERRALKDAIDSQREQRERATQNQIRNIENELIRQQINNP